MKENWTCQNVLCVHRPTRILVSNFFESNEVVNFLGNEKTKIHKSDIGVWKIKTKK